MTIQIHLSGNMRLFSEPPSWNDEIPGTQNGSRIVAENAFGLQFIKNSDSTISVYDPETRTIQNTGLEWGDFFILVQENADELVDQLFYDACVNKFGPIEVTQHYAFLVELTIGGKKSVENVEVLDSHRHMSALLEFSSQICNLKPGTRINKIR